MSSKPNRKFGHVLITGASSGIGEALALRLSAPGVRLTLCGRDRVRLDAVAAACRARGALVTADPVDVTDRAAMREWAAGADRSAPVDLAIANAGISAGTGGVLHGEPPEQVRDVFDVNLNGVLNTLDPLVPLMAGRGRGTLAVMSSLAGFRGWPGAPAYCASKAAVRVYGESLRGALAPAGVRVCVVCPGFVVSRITDANAFPMPFLMPAGKAADIIVRGLEQNKGRIIFPAPVALAVWLMSVMPDAIAAKIAQQAPSKALKN